ncbi:hypothetical protein BC834DRAFT_891951 [Gloeopeniophorella convolvens]|nr:hypothetical protein BC834DRAFT_891951 [Gloeopeniophorella convolvens]
MDAISSFKENLRKAVPTHLHAQRTTTTQADAPSSSVTPAIGRSNDDTDAAPESATKNLLPRALEASLEWLKESSELAVAVPCLGPVAGILLGVLRMTDEIRQCREQWAIVMRKLARVASIVVNFGEQCRRNGMKEENLPGALLDIFRWLQSELQRIEHVLRQCVQVSRIRMVFIRKDVLERIKQYDAEITDVLNVFQTQLALDNRFAQITAKQREKRASPSRTERVVDLVVSRTAPLPVRLAYDVAKTVARDRA